MTRALILAAALLAFAGCNSRPVSYRVQWVSPRTALMEPHDFARYCNELNAANGRPICFDEPVLANAGANGGMFTSAFRDFAQTSRDVSARPIEDAGSIYFTASDYLILRVEHLGQQTSAERRTLIACQARRDDRTMGKGRSVLWSVFAQSDSVRHD